MLMFEEWFKKNRDKIESLWLNPSRPDFRKPIALVDFAELEYHKRRLYGELEKMTPLEHLQKKWIPKLEREIEEIEQLKRDIESYNDNRSRVPIDTGFETVVLNHRRKILQALLDGDLEAVHKMNLEISDMVKEFIQQHPELD